MTPKDTEASTEPLPPFKDWYAKTKDYGGTREEWQKMKDAERAQLETQTQGEQGVKAGASTEPLWVDGKIMNPHEVTSPVALERELREEIGRMIFKRLPNPDTGLYDVKSFLDDIEALLTHTIEEAEVAKQGYDPNRLGSWIFIGDNARLENLDDLYWSYVQEYVANDNPYREEPYEKMDYIKKNMPYASFSGVGTTKLFARADQHAKARIAKIRGGEGLQK